PISGFFYVIWPNSALEKYAISRDTGKLSPPANFLLQPYGSQNAHQRHRHASIIHSIHAE
ncbi:MAG: hypothetical protein JBO36_22065, partial [Candidatus Thiodiazotropha taylori]|nr:hypothetical protein [Candidatus Thiodiazotropha taylori]MCG7973346.1 hypothetical protein [Candidatus Thiodiazotropha taylori]